MQEPGIELPHEGFCPLGDTGRCLETLLVVSTEAVECTTVISWVEARHAANCPTMRGTGPHNRNYPSQMSVMPKEEILE